MVLISNPYNSNTICVHIEKKEKKDITTCKEHILYKEMMFNLRESFQI